MFSIKLSKFCLFYNTFRFRPLFIQFNEKLIKNFKYNSFEKRINVYKAFKFWVIYKKCNNFSNGLKTINNSKLKNNFWAWDIVSGVLIWLGFIDDYENRENPFILTIKRGILCTQRKEFERAEIILHSALKMAQDLDFESAETYIFDLLANNAFQKEDFKTAEKLFIEVLKRVISKGMKPNEEPIIEISIKLATIYSKTEEFTKCEEGFRFCLNEQNKRVEPFIHKSLDELTKEEINSLALWGMCLDYYAKHLSSIGRFSQALDHYKSALSVCQQINGNTHPQTLVLMNDTAATLIHLNDYENALAYLKKAINGAIRTESEDLALFYYNIGSIYLTQCNYDLAQISCRESLNYSLQLKDKILEKKARECLIKSRN